MIPKIIHYVWVGPNEKPAIVQHCMASWKHFLPEYEIRSWGNEALNNINIAYVDEAFKMKKWAFVSDYLRLHALYEHGGFYFDTDLEVTANLDRFIGHTYVTGFEDFGGNLTEGYPITALMGSEKGNHLIKKMLDEYNHERFILPNGDLNILPNTERITNLIRREYNFSERLIGSNILHLEDDMVVYPSHFFSTPQTGKENYSIHHFDASWHTNFSRQTIFKIGPYKVTLFRRKNLNKPFNYIHYGNESELISLQLSTSLIISILKRA